ncbi:glycine cleavage system protein GcvH [Ruicaihuangia caeni]|uniref:glycine cleavage system protein GcvH n=1 Tax=Ruicaihuangia caeni TaxID=3042517 RepID=UPI00338F4B0A
MSNPDDLRYTAQHEWLRIEGDEVTIGITDYAAEQLGDVVFVELPEIGARVERGAVVAEVESTKSVGEVYAPAAGEVVARHDDVVDAPESINGDAFEAWLFRLRVDDPASLEGSGLLDRKQYLAQLGG